MKRAPGLSFEVYPHPSLDAAAIPEHWTVHITCTGKDIDPTLRLYERLRPRAIPHVAASHLASRAHAWTVAGLVTDNVFLIGGDAKPKGPFDRAAQLFPYFADCGEIGVAAYPEGHPAHPGPEGDDLLDAVLLEKQRLWATYAVTQMCFDPNAIIAWARRVREKGFTLPIICGVCAPLNVLKLARFARRCGVSQSLHFLEKMSARNVLTMISSYDPRPLMEAVRDYVDGFHIYTFNALAVTAAWVERTPWAEKLAAPGPAAYALLPAGGEDPLGSEIHRDSREN